jgi:hypothetical protein
MLEGMFSVGLTDGFSCYPAILREQILQQRHGFTFSLALHDWEPVGTIFDPLLVQGAIVDGKVEVG